ncbi:hypothetical protein F0562_001931 [Nyssa sinensis]|uniref:Uncharacterized protein n=1 Tax=Nyssa sinensis TaxID=561372 RepID=A0A5J5C8G1_9ASTE|nr:hypothetical protein F0562_001931 [Nyssa sinensis]
MCHLTNRNDILYGKCFKDPNDHFLTQWTWVSKREVRVSALGSVMAPTGKVSGFNREGNDWFCNAGLPSDITVATGGVNFHLHKIMLEQCCGDQQVVEYSVVKWILVQDFLEKVTKNKRK